MHIASAQTVEFAVLHSLRVRGFASPDAVAESSGVDEADVAEVLARCAERGEVRIRDGRITGALLTGAGKDRWETLRTSLIGDDVRAAVEQAYDTFLALNGELKQLVTDWQLRAESGVTADDVIARLSDLHRAATELLTSLATAAPRFGLLASRLDAAHGAFADGDEDALAKPLTGCYHDVWMELHEDLLATLGRERSDADG